MGLQQLSEPYYKDTEHANQLSNIVLKLKNSFCMHAETCAFLSINKYASLTSATLADLYPHSIPVLDVQFHWAVIPLTTQGRHCVHRRGTIPAQGTQQRLVI